MKYARAEKDRGRRDMPHNIAMAREALRDARRVPESRMLAENARRAREGEGA